MNVESLIKKYQSGGFSLEYVSFKLFLGKKEMLCFVKVHRSGYGKQQMVATMTADYNGGRCFCSMNISSNQSKNATAITRMLWMALHKRGYHLPRKFYYQNADVVFRGEPDEISLVVSGYIQQNYLCKNSTV